ncbi:efflux RND transporter permease subunit [Microbulbifer thermotolerans]|uniref:efflux RND transporter permease subunit n=1 Tax=Microbulbifer thermotolerans TaxID=252514 RepID=UPI0022492ECD|nr:efflux RND transporter permease subunit [Microbulbifer thermotolerans]MCX2830141.1 efflux RND transporter permease subunit [Microbulbifer thermotolerans]MCX2841257.1 efflux RND transporter permease subunit [Microbulbifer thermotolerans]
MRDDCKSSPSPTPDIHRSDLASLAIRRPVLALVLNLLIAIAGIAAFSAVEVRELPDVDVPIVSVRGQMPGASPETMDSEVTSIVEGAVARVSGIKHIESSSEENNFRIHIEFNSNIDLDTAASDVREAVSQVQRELPEDAEQLVVVKAADQPEPVIYLAVTSDQLRDEALTYIIEKDIIPELVSVPGVADVPIFGQRQRVLRVVLDPLRLTSFGLSVSDVAAVLERAPLDVPSGSFQSEDQQLLVRADASTVTEEQVRNIIIRGDVRIGDIAYVSFGPEDVQSLVYLNNRPVIGLAVVRQAQSNTIEISDGVRRAVDKLNRRFDNLHITVTEDRAVFIRGSVKEVVTSLCYTVLIVIAAIWLFFGNIRTTLVPSTAIPIALIGTLAGIWLMGFSINILTLLAIVLATGLVVDDAIVVLENIQRLRTQGMGARAAAVLGTRQVVFAVLATTAVLISVFIPIALLPSTAGRMFREFGLVLATAVALSSVVALTLVPMLTARITQGGQAAREGRYYGKLVRAGGRIGAAYERSLATCLRHGWLSFSVALLVAVGAGFLYQLLGKELLPPEDRGVIRVNATGPDGVGQNYIGRQAAHIESAVQPLVARGDVSDILTEVGRYDPNRARVTLLLAPWEERTVSQQALMQEILGPLQAIPGARIHVNSPNSLSLRGAGGDVEVALVGNDYPRIYEAARQMARAIEDRLPHLGQPDISYRPTQPQLSIEIDRRRAADLGVPLDNIATTLRAVVDGLDVTDLNVGDEAVPVMLEAADTTISSPEDLVNLYVKNDSGKLLPLSSMVTLHEESVAAELDRHGQRRAIEISAGLEPGYPLASAVEELRALASEVLPEDIGILFLGEADTLEESSREVAMTYAIAALVVFLVLCAQFEGISSAVIVMVTVPFGLAAAIYALFLTSTTVNIFSQIGLVMLIGLMAKNGILLVEFADQLRDRGHSVYEAVIEAARVRLRPIAMTMLSTVLGGLPLILSSGPGAEARGAIGWVMFGGLGLAALFTLYLTPVVYLGLGRFHKPRSVERGKLEEELQAAAEQSMRGGQGGHL